MFGIRLSKALSAIGIDFGTCSLRAVQVRRAGTRWEVHHWINLEAEITTPEPVPPHRPEDIALAFGPGSFSGHRFALALSPPDVDYHLMEVPGALLSQSSAQLRTALQIELDRQTECPVTECEIAAWAVRQSGAARTPAMIVAARRKALEARLELLAGRGLTCERADIVPNGMIRIRREALNGTAQPDHLWGLLDLGFQAARLYLMHDDRPIYARVLRGGGRDLTETLAKTLKVDFSIAERYKRVYGIRPGDRGFRSVIGGLGRITETELPDVLYAILRPTIEAMAQDIERSYRFVLEQTPGMQAGPLYLIGGGARLSGLIDVLSARLGVPVTLPDPKAVFGELQSGEPNRHPLLKPANYCVVAACAGLVMKKGSV